MVCGVGKTLTDTKKIAIVSVYIPPNQKAAVTKKQMECLADLVEKLKLECNDPYIVLGGDFNERQLSAIEDFPNSIVQTLRTRGRKVLDIVATNIEEYTEEVINPLETEEGVQSDHKSVLIKARLPRLHQYTTTEFYTRKYDQSAEEAFGRDLLSQDWTSITGTATERADKLDEILQYIYNLHFPLVKRKIRSCHPPWITKRIKRLIRNRKRIFRRYGRGELWKRKKIQVEEEIRLSKQRFFERVKEKVRLDGNNAGFFKAAQMLSTGEQKDRWAIQHMCPGQSDASIAEEGAVFF